MAKNPRPPAPALRPESTISPKATLAAANAVRAKLKPVSQRSIEELVNSLDVTPSALAEIKARLAGMPVSYRLTYVRAMTGKSMKAAIRAACQECVGYQDCKEQIGGCTDPACPLYPYRPYQ